MTGNTRGNRPPSETGACVSLAATLATRGNTRSFTPVATVCFRLATPGNTRPRPFKKGRGVLPVAGLAREVRDGG